MASLRIDINDFSLILSPKFHNYYNTDTSGPENVTSGSDGEADSDADNVFLPSRANNPASPNDTESHYNLEKPKAVPKTLNLGR